MLVNLEVALTKFTTVNGDFVGFMPTLVKGVGFDELEIRL
jgi:hypothetical protein